MCFVFPFFFRRWLIHAKCLTMPAMRSAGDRIPFDVHGLSGGSKKPVQKVYFGHHTSSICELLGQAPQATCEEKHLVLASSFCFVLC